MLFTRLEQPLEALTQCSGKPQSGTAGRTRLAAGRGLWATRDDLPDFAALRREFDRSSELKSR